MNNKKAFLMTVEEYQTQVSPLFKEFNAFLRKYSKYFKKQQYYGVALHTYPEFYKEYFADLEEMHPILAKDDTYVNKAWSSNSDRVFDEVPAEVLKTYNDLIERFRKYFSEEAIIGKIERDEAKSNKRSVRRAIDDDSYVNYLKDGLITPAELEMIFSSNGIKIPSNIMKLKTKVESQGYNRNVENMFLKRTKEFENEIRIQLGPHYDQLKERERKWITGVVELYEKFDKKDLDCYHFEQSFSSKGFGNTAARLVKSLMDQTASNRIVTAIRKQNFQQLVEQKCIEYAENFITSYVARLNEKCLVINNKIGIPTSIALDKVSFSSGVFEGCTSIQWENGAKIIFESQVIIAGGPVQRDHYRYLLKPFHNGKMIDLETIDAAKL